MSSKTIKLSLEEMMRETTESLKEDKKLQETAAKEQENPQEETLNFSAPKAKEKKETAESDEKAPKPVKKKEKSTDDLSEIFKQSKSAKGGSLNLYFDAEVIAEIDKRMKAAGMKKGDKSKVYNALVRKALGLDEK